MREKKIKKNNKYSNIQKCFFATALQNLIGQNVRKRKRIAPLAIQQEQKQTGTHRSTNLQQKSASDCSFEDCTLAGKAGSLCTSLLPSQTFGRQGYRDRHFKEKIHRLQIEKHNVRMQSEFQMAGGGALNYAVVTVRCGRQKRL